MEFGYILEALNPATGTSLPIPLFIISGIILVGCIVFAIVTKVMKGKGSGSGMNKRRKRRK